MRQRLLINLPHVEGALWNRDAPESPDRMPLVDFVVGNWSWQGLISLINWESILHIRGLPNPFNFAVSDSSFSFFFFVVVERFIYSWEREREKETPSYSSLSSTPNDGWGGGRKRGGGAPISRPQDHHLSRNHELVTQPTGLPPFIPYSFNKASLSWCSFSNYSFWLS